MYINFLLPIADRAYMSAERRGKKPNCFSCVTASSTEIAEYFKAYDEDRVTSPDDIRHAERLQDDSKFKDFYASKIHNTTLDEMADICIVAATWASCAKLCENVNGLGYDPDRNHDTILANGLVAFVIGKLDAVGTAELKQVINLKLRYNEIRED